MIAREMWRTAGGKFLTAEINGMRLIVETPSDEGGPVRFQALRLGSGESPDDVIASGVRPDVRGAMAAAEEMAASRALD